MMRVTTNGTLFSYKSNLMKSTNQLNSAMDKLMTQRNFTSFAADPSAASRSFKVHSALNATNAQHSNVESVMGKYQTAWSNMEMVVDDLANTLGNTPAIKGLNATNLDAIDTQAIALRSGAESIVTSMNAQYSDDYIFAGADNVNPPYDIVEDATTGLSHVTFRGVRVDDAASLTQVYTDADGNQMLDDAGIPMTNQQVLDKWNNEGLYVDIGLGFELDAAGNVIESTAFDAAISGLDVLGYGVDADGDPKNLASVMLRLADEFDALAVDSTDMVAYNNAENLLGKFQDSQDNMIDKHAALSAQAAALEKTQLQLEDRYDALNVERSSIEDVDMADAIMALSWAQVTYNAALQVGANVVPQSLMDYMK